MSGKKELETELEKWKNLSDKHLELFLLMTLWMREATGLLRSTAWVMWGKV